MSNGPKQTEEKNKKVAVTVRTPAGAPHDFVVELHERIDKLSREAIAYFVGETLLEPGPYALALVRNGAATNLEDNKRLEDYGIEAGDVLHLIPKKPQVDG